MVENLNKVTCGALEVLGYSVAGEETVVAAPTLDCCFDIGKCPDEALPINHVLLSHGHMDHAAGIAYYFSQRNFREMAAGTLLLPASLARPVEDLLDVWGRLDGARPPANIVPIRPGQEYEIRRNLFAYAFETNHQRDSLGFTIIERRQKLKEQYLGLPGPDIAQLKQQGVEITHTLEIPLITYLGDTMGGPFENLPCVQKSKILIAECTFFEEEHRDRARAGKHYHFRDLSQALLKMENDCIILTHLSRRTFLREARKAVKDTLPPELAEKIVFLMERGHENV